METALTKIFIYVVIYTFTAFLFLSLISCTSSRKYDGNYLSNMGDIHCNISGSTITFTSPYVGEKSYSCSQKDGYVQFTNADKEVVRLWSDSCDQLKLNDYIILKRQ